MKTVIWKFQITEELILMPVGAKILQLWNQNNRIYAWVEIDPHAEKEERRFKCIETGVEVPKDGTYINTWHLFNDELFVVHVYEMPVLKKVGPKSVDLVKEFFSGKEGIEVTSMYVAYENGKVVLNFILVKKDERLVIDLNMNTSQDGVNVEIEQYVNNRK